jgi:hypothetical protein
VEDVGRDPGVSPLCVGAAVEPGDMGAGAAVWLGLLKGEAHGSSSWASRKTELT